MIGPRPGCIRRLAAAGVTWTVGRESNAKYSELLNGNQVRANLHNRESRRMVSDVVMTEHDCCRLRPCSDPVGQGSYNMDSHNVRRFVTRNGFVQNEGDLHVSPGGVYQISCRAIVPARGEVSNLLVPVCISASHIACGSIRITWLWMRCGWCRHQTELAPGSQNMLPSTLSSPDASGVPGCVQSHMVRTSSIPTTEHRTARTAPMPMPVLVGQPHSGSARA